MPAHRSHDGSHHGFGQGLLAEKLAKRMGKSSRDGRDGNDADAPLAHFDRVVARMSAAALRQNYSAIQEQVPRQAILPMIKANGYGHGAEWVARALAQLPNLYGLGLASFEEALEVREAIGLKSRKLPVIVFSGTVPWTEEKGRFCEQYGLTPVIETDSDWHAFLKQGWPGKIPYEIKFNTGLNRLGLNLNSAPSVVKAFRHRESNEHPNGVMTHLAMGESPDDKLSRSQREKFMWLRSEFGGAIPSAHFHLANSGAIWAQKQWGLDGLTDAVRPGLSLYGVVPWKGAPERGTRPVMTLEALVIHTSKLKPGESLGYGGAFKVKGTQSVGVAILAAGYADGVFRALSDRGHVWLNGKRRRFLGRVSMDLSAVEADGDVRVGDWAQILGASIDPWVQAEAAGTIPYELLTSVSDRVQRKYE